MTDDLSTRSKILAKTVRSRRSLFSTAAAATVAGSVASCSRGGGSGSAESEMKKKIEHPSDNLNKQGFPVVKEPITVHFMTRRSPHTAKDYNKVLVWNKYQKMTNVRIKWGLIPTDSIEEKRNLALSGGDYPEVFYNTLLDVRDVEKYGNQGTFIRLNELIDKYMPNLSKIMDREPGIKQGMTFPNGSIYGLPYIIDRDFTALRISKDIWVRNDWLDKFDMNVPSTTDQYYKYLKMVRSKHPNGKGKTIPYGSSYQGNELYLALTGSFGIGNRGSTVSKLDADPDDPDKARFIAVTDGYKDLMEYLHKLYRDGLVAKDIMSMDQSKAWNATKAGVYGSTTEIAPNYMYGGAAKHFVPLPALKGPDGHHSFNRVTSPLGKIADFVITDKCKHPVELARWADYFYSDKGARLFYMGVAGKSYNKTEDGVEYIDKIRHPEKGVDRDDALKPYVTYMGGHWLLKQEYFKGSESSDESVKSAKLLAPDAQKALKDGWPAFTFTEDEFQKLDSLADDIEKYVDESRDKFITGDLKLSQWNTYVDKLKKMGLDEYMEIQQAAYDRYRKGQ